MVDVEAGRKHHAETRKDERSRHATVSGCRE
jgi:hypothetical protein